MWARSGAMQILVFGGAWSVLTEGDLASWLIGGPMVLVATALGLTVFRGDGTCLRLHGLPIFAVQFIYESVRGGCDVAYRAFHPDLPISPGVIATSFGGAHDAERALTTCAANLLPGTLTVDESADHMIVHVLHTGVNGLDDIALLHQRVALVFEPVESVRASTT